MRTVEGEQPRLDFLDGEAGNGASEFLREQNPFEGTALFLFVRQFHERQPVGERERRLEAVGKPRLDVGAHHQPVHHHVDVVLELLVERRRLGDFAELAVDLHALEAAFEEFGKLLAVFALAPAHHRRQ